MTETARMYGGSLYDLAAEEGLDERILGELDGVTALLNGDAEYLHLLSIPSIPKKERCALLDEAFRGQVDRKSTRLNSSHYQQSRMPSSA